MTKEKSQYIQKSIFSVTVFVLTYMVVHRQAFWEGTDYFFHMQTAMDVHLKGFLSYFLEENSYPLWHILVKVVYKLGNCFGNISVEYCVAILTSVINVSTYLIIDYWLDKYKICGHHIVSFLLMILGPLYMPWFNSFIYYGQGSANVWHNPTTMMVKPFAIMAFFMTVDVIHKIKEGECVSGKEYVKIAILFLVSVFAKPSFVQGFFPTLGLYIIGLCIYTKRIKQNILLLCTMLPVTIIVFAQFVISFYCVESGAGVGIGWLEVLSQCSPNPLISLALVVAFPLLYLILNLQEVKKPDIQLSYLYLLISWLEAALLYENGDRKYHGNFTWAVALAYTIVFIVSVAHFAKNLSEMEMSNKAKRVKNAFLLVLLISHVFIGIYYVYGLIVNDCWF